FAEVKNSYFREHMRYKLAGLYQVTQTFTQQQIGKSYFSDSPVLYMNVEYMKFFNDYFKKYLTATSRFLKYNDYNHLLVVADPYKTLMNALGTDSILKSTKLRELVLMKGLVEMYNTQGYDKDRLLEVFKVISTGSAAMENRKIAENILYILTKLRPGTPAPPFKLKNQEQKEVTLADFKGKPVVLNFWTTYCQGCLTEMDKTKTLMDKYKDQVAFISIGADKDFRKMLFFITQKKEYTWNFLHLGANYEMLKDYEVKSYPFYVLIDKAGNISQCPAELPGSGLDLQLQKLLNQ
ncbi:MAG: TlpA disulfide reductase family protein, partial [Bacteroidota bacterium]